MIAALFVERGGVYAGLPDVDPWDVSRDARTYAGPWPVCAHPPCSRWCRLAGLVEARWGHKRGEDGGCFEAALNCVRTWGGVLEHPAYSDAWPAFDLPYPSRSGGWQRGMCGGWSAHVEQGRYGHPAKKATWLYSFGVDSLPMLRWGAVPDGHSKALVSWCGNHVRSNENRPRVGKREASRTPVEFRDILIGIARSARSGGVSDKNAVEMMRHAIGQGGRNHYCAEKPSMEWSQWCGLVVIGLARFGLVINDGRDQYFHVTDRGREYLNELACDNAARRSVT